MKSENLKYGDIFVLKEDWDYNQENGKTDIKVYHNLEGCTFLEGIEVILVKVIEHLGGNWSVIPISDPTNYDWIKE